MSGTKNMKVKEIKKNNKLIAILLPKEFSKEGTIFFTGDKNLFQLGKLQYKKGAKIKSHIHNVFERKIKGTQEVFYVQEGWVRANLYDKKGKKIKSLILKAGDTLLIISAGHGFEMLGNSKILVLKQGPYYGLKEDKSFL